MTSPTRLYLDLLKKSLLEELYVENELRLLYLRQCLEGKEAFRQDIYLNIRKHKPAMHQEYVKLRETGINYGRSVQNLGFQHTMIGRARMENIESCLDRIVADKIPGDAIECGVWRGGATVFMKGFFAVHQEHSRRVWVADSFEGLPVPSLKQDAGSDLSAAHYPMLAIDLDTVRDLFVQYGLLDDQVRFLKGWFKDTLHEAPIETLSLLRLDGDLYESTMDTLEPLYKKVAPGGFIIADDYGAFPQCKQAITEFRAKHNINDPIVQVDWTGVYWRKSA